jgi:hypothetical protein
MAAARGAPLRAPSYTTSGDTTLPEGGVPEKIIQSLPSSCMSRRLLLGSLKRRLRSAHMPLFGAGPHERSRLKSHGVGRGWGLNATGERS